MGRLDLPALARAEVRPESGPRMPLGRLWQGLSGPRILVWLRHFG
jgi:hypothetical protein